MRGDDKVIELLNAVLKNELTAINQYFLHSRMLDNWGVTKLAKYEYGESIDEMRHADWVIKRILFLDGLPNLQALGRLRIGESVPEILAADLALEMEALPALREGALHADAVRDYVSRDLFVRILKSEEEHVDYIEAALGQIERMGLANFIQNESEPTGAGEKDAD